MVWSEDYINHRGALDGLSVADVFFCFIKSAFDGFSVFVGFAFVGFSVTGALVAFITGAFVGLPGPVDANFSSSRMRRFLRLDEGMLDFLFIFGAFEDSASGAFDPFIDLVGSAA